MQQDFFGQEGQQLAALGYDIVPVDYNKKSINIKNWQKKDFTKPNGKDYTGYGVGIKTGKTPVLDIDITHTHIAEMIQSYARRLVGCTIERVGKAPKTAFVYRTEEPFTKITSSMYVDENGINQRVECLGDGQQLVAFNLHPDTQKPYVWSDDIPNVEDLPVLTRDHAIQICEYADELIQSWTDWQLKTKGSKGQAGGIEDNPFAELPHECVFTERQVTEMLVKIDPNIHNDEWIKVLMALHSTGMPWAEPLARKWSAISPKYDEHAFTVRWDSLHAGGPISIGTLEHMARDAGYREVVTPLGLESLDEFILTDEDVADIQGAEFIYQRVIVRGHLIGIMGEPGAGKTTVMEWIAARLPGLVYYINGDIANTDMPEAQSRAKKGRYRLLCPDGKVAKSMGDIVDKLKGIAASDTDLSEVTFIIDTLKKIAEVISKQESREVYQLLRQLTGRGATVVCLGHCNKYRDADGWPIYEGTADLRSDFDELALLHPLMLDYGQVVTSLYWKEDGVPWGKSRAQTEAMSWNMDIAHGKREVTELDDWRDTIEEGRQKKQAKKLESVNAAIAGYIFAADEPPGFKELYENTGHPVRVSREAIKAGMGKFWETQTGTSNKKLHYLLPDGEKLATKDARALLGKNQ